MGEAIEYPDILQELRGAMNPGRLKLQSNNFIFKNLKTGIVTTVQAEDIESCMWLIRARGYCLKIVLADGNIHRFDGFKESEYDKLSNFIEKHYNKELKKKETSLKGWNWGVANFIGNSLEFEVDKNHLFEIPLNNVSHTVIAKNEVTLEFHQNDDASVSLTELRFHIPSDSKDSEKDPANEFYQNVLSQADIIQATGDAIANFSEVQCLTPRGRYDIKIYQAFMQLHGKTFDYKIPYKTILRLFLLPHRDNRQMFFVVSLDPPIKQGQTRYHFLILLFNKEDETTLELALSEKDIAEKYEGKLTQCMQGPEYEIISRVMKTLVNRKITVPGTFIGHSGTHSVSCSYKAATGFLYPLERGFIFVHKPPIHIRFDEVANVNFARSSGSSRSFDFEVETKAGAVYTFISIEKEEYAKLYDFVKNKKLRVKNIGDKLDKKGGVTYDDMLGSDDEGHDAYLERMKAEGKQREDDDEGEDDDDSSDDEDFDPDANEIFSEPEDEFDSEVESSDSSEESGSGSSETAEEKKPKKEKKKKKTRTVREGPRKKRNKKHKDPNAPKRPQSAYFLWLNEHREQIKKEHPGISLTDLTKKAGEMWRELKDKTEWEERYARDKEAYNVAKSEYEQQLRDNPPSANDSDRGGPSPKKKRRSSPAASADAAGKFKSKEFISDESSSEDDADSDDSDKPLTKLSKKEKKPRRKRGESASEPDELPSEESDAAMTGGSSKASEQSEDSD